MELEKDQAKLKTARNRRTELTELIKSLSTAELEKETERNNLKTTKITLGNAKEGYDMCI